MSVQPILVFARDADNDLYAITDGIAQENPTAARRWLAKIVETCKMLADNPAVGEARNDLGISGCRSFSVGNYVIFFRAVEGGIEVARVLHGARDIRSL